MSFLRPKAPAMQPLPPPPVIEDTSAKEQEAYDALRRRRGRAAAILHGDGPQPVTAAKSLLGG
jgi:hypothetical protein